MGSLRSSSLTSFAPVVLASPVFVLATAPLSPTPYRPTPPRTAPRLTPPQPRRSLRAPYGRPPLTASLAGWLAAAEGGRSQARHRMR